MQYHFTNHYRLLSLLAGVCIGFLALAIRLVDLQLVQGSTYRQISEENRFFRKSIPAERGVFFDRFKNPLVFNKPVYYKIDDPSKIFSEESLLTNQEAVEMMVASPAAVVRRTFRHYPNAQSLSGVLGYVGAVTKEEIQRHSQLKSDDEVGKIGLEKSLDFQIRGQDGEEVYELNARGLILREISEEPAKAGKNVHLTIDSELNAFVAEQMKAVKGAVVIGNPKTGELLSLVSTPSYDANVLSHPVYSTAEAKVKVQVIQNYFSDSNKLFFNRAISGSYPPGSVFKLVTALAGLEQGAFTVDTMVVDEGVLKVNDFEFGNWYYRQYGRVEGAVSVRRALARSNDIFFYKAAEWLGPQKLADSARMFGFGQPTGIELGSEAKGLVPDPAWKEKTIGEPWYLGNTYHFGIGQGDLLVTPLQIFNMTTVFANEGKRCVPHIISTVEGSDEKKKIECQELGYSSEYLQAVWEGMVAACSTEGTAFPFFPWNTDHEGKEKVACKTGTAEFGAANEKGYRNTHGWFTMVGTLVQDEKNTSPVSTGSAQIKEFLDQYPKEVVITVLVESDEAIPFKEGSRDAAPIAKAIYDWMNKNRTE